MSFRPSISIYLGQDLLDVGIYPDWEIKDLFFEALAVGALFSSCRTAQEYRRLRNSRRTIVSFIDPENEDRALADAEALSDYCLVVDLQAGCIYHKSGCLSREEPGALPLYEGRVSDWREEDYSRLLNNYRISFTEPGPDRILDFFRNSADLTNRLSRRTLEQLERSCVIQKS